MPLETGTYISDLVSTNPANTDVIEKADDHLRLIKATLLATFPNITGAVTATHTELNILDGVTATTAELNLLDGVTVTTAADLSKLNSAGTPQFTALELGHASDTTLTRASAGVVAVEGTNLVKAGAATASGLTMATDRLLGRDTAATGAIEELTAGSGLGFSSGALVLNGPAFHVHKNGTNQTATDAVETLITWSTELFDTNANFASNKFTPTVAGYYLFTVSVRVDDGGTSPANPYCFIMKNGSAASAYYGTTVQVTNGVQQVTANVIISMNGSTDYVEAYGYANVGSGSTTFNGGAESTYFSGCFVRGL